MEWIWEHVYDIVGWLVLYVYGILLALLSILSFVTMLLSLFAI